MIEFRKALAWLLAGAFLLAPQTLFAQDDEPTEASLEADNVTASVDANAQEAADQNEWNYAKRYSQRTLTMQKGMIRANGIVTVWDDGVDTIVGAAIGGAISVCDKLELGINNYRVGSSLQKNYEALASVEFTPDAGFGDIPVYGRYSFLKRDKLEIASDLVFIIPSNTAFAMEVAIPLRILINDKLSIDTGVETRGTFGSFKRADVRLPAIINYNFSDRAYIAGETGVQFVNLGKNFDAAGADSEGVAFPAGFRAGGTWKKENKNLIDLFSGFSFTQLIQTGTSRKTIDFGVWDIYVNIVFHTRPLF